MKRWEPVEDGHYGAMEVFREELYMEGPDINGRIVRVYDTLPADIRLCRQVEAPSIPPEVAETIREALEHTLNDREAQLSITAYAMPNGIIQRLDAALAWLEQEAGE